MGAFQGLLELLNFEVEDVYLNPFNRGTIFRAVEEFVKNVYFISVAHWLRRWAMKLWVGGSNPNNVYLNLFYRSTIFRAVEEFVKNVYYLFSGSSVKTLDHETLGRRFEF